MGNVKAAEKKLRVIIKIKGQKLCTECADKTQKDIDPDSLNFSACI